MKEYRYLSYNGQLLLMALLFFALNQGLEYGLLRSAGADYGVLCDWDCPWYASIVESGYDSQPHAHEKHDAANWAFFPAFPMTATALSAITGIDAHTMLPLTSKLFFLLSIFAFIKLVQTWSPQVSTWLAGSVVAFQPYAIYGNVGYTESMFLLFTCLSFIALKTRAHVRTGLAAAVLSAVRPVGVLMMLPMCIAAWRRWPKVAASERARIVLGLQLAPLGLAIFMLYLYWLTGDALAFSHIQVAWQRDPINPLLHLQSGLLQGDGWLHMVALMCVGALAMTAFLLWRREYELAVFSLLATLVPLSTGLSAMPRYLWWQAPLLLVLTWGLDKVSRWRPNLKLRLLPLPVAMRIRAFPHWLLALPVGLWGLAIMYDAWFTRLGWVI